MSRDFCCKGFYRREFCCKGFYLSMEAIISLIMLISILLVSAGNEHVEFSELYLFQKENDLLKVWGAEGKFSKDEMISDFKFVFGSVKGAIEIGSEKILVNDSGNGIAEGDAIASTAYFYNYELEEIKITVTVFS